MRIINVIEGNKIIAEFMGYKYYPPSEDKYGKTRESWNIPLDQPQYYPPFGYAIYNWNNCKFHSSWDWLKPVIDKIIKTIGVKSIDECSKEEWFQSTRIVGMYIGVDIEQAHHYVVEFIKWYNTQK